VKHVLRGVEKSQEEPKGEGGGKGLSSREGEDRGLRVDEKTDLHLRDLERTQQPVLREVQKASATKIERKSEGTGRRVKTQSLS